MADILAGLREAARIEKGYIPTKADLADAPLLSAWWVEALPLGHYRLAGYVRGHPRLADGWCGTSIVLAIDPEGAWARTISRYYRLGLPWERQPQ